MAWWVRMRAVEHEDLSSDLLHLCEKVGVARSAHNPSAVGSRDRKITEACHT